MVENLPLHDGPSQGASASKIDKSFCFFFQKEGLFFFEKRTKKLLSI
jgi:hypothetical protein